MSPTHRQRALRILYLALFVAILLCGFFASSPHIRACSICCAFVLGSLMLASWWAGEDTRRRRIVFVIILFSPVVVLSLELIWRYTDWKEQRLISPLQKTPRGTRSGMMMANWVSNYQLVPDQTYEFWGGSIHIDRRGFRSIRNVELEKAPQTIRIILMGGSAAFGWGLPDGQDLAACLQKDLEQRTPSQRFEVINAGVPFFTSYQETNWYTYVLANYHPDVLIVLDGRNDADAAVVQGSNWKPVSEGDVGELPFCDLADDSEERPATGPGDFLLQSSFYRRIFDLASHDSSASPPPVLDPLNHAPGSVRKVGDGFIDPRFITQFKRHHELLAAEAARQGTRCLFAVQPIIYLGKTLTPEEERYAAWWEGMASAMQHIWPAMQEAITQPLGWHVLARDLTRVFAHESASTYLDECHYNANGTRCLAKVLTDDLLAWQAFGTPSSRPR